MFGCMPALPTDVIMGMPQADIPDLALQYTHKTVENLQFAYELQGKIFVNVLMLKLRRIPTYDISSFSVVIWCWSINRMMPE